MPEKKEYRNARRSRMLIRDAFMALLQEKPFEKITATDIINRADVNRSTFYAHYPDVRGLVEEILDEIVDSSTKLVKELNYQNLFQNPRPFVEKLVTVGEKYRGLYGLINQSNFVYQQTNRLKSAFIEKTLNAPEIPESLRQNKKFEIRTHFFIGGIFNTYQQWILGALECSGEEIVTEISELIVSSSESMMRGLLE